MAAVAENWWRGGVIYHIYPRSFLDTNGDGIGDLPGILRRLDYVASLGVDAVWLSPFFTSPMRDFGYDVSNYRDVDPMFGTLEDFIALLEAAHERDLKIIIDQVYSHTSEDHPWFRESRVNRVNPRADWYVWADAKPDGTPPTNWQSVFGGPSWQWEGRRKQYYMHNFLSSQPDLNLHNPEVQDALLEVARFWLELGVDGFRLDAINFAMHDLELKDNPPSEWPPEWVTRPFDMQIHRYNRSDAAIPQFLERLRSVLDAYDARFSVAEVFGPTPLVEMQTFTSPGRIHSAYNFDFLYAEKLTGDHVRQCIEAWAGDQVESWPSWAFSNHDAPRSASRWARSAEPADLKRQAKLNLLLLLALRGSLFLYQGEELGLPQSDVPFEALQDPEAIANWPHTLGRDGARTPFPWTEDRDAGFSTVPPWLPVDHRHPQLSVTSQETDPKSVLNFLRRALALRRAMPALQDGGMTFIEGAADEDLLVFLRGTAPDETLCTYNFGDHAITWQPEDPEAWEIVLATGSRAHGPPGSTIPPRSGYWAVRRRYI
ncbi:alpha amylase family protein [Parvularcula bermudensis HTCC2503]|uniref:Alpha amylase family protein n=2 Tax=Parvularcula TaxID=208215 RepID=E0TD36_PARBH|nr:alpha amylase family protein [Parvularcula bermudensis HTCC2503]